MSEPIDSVLNKIKGLKSCVSDAEEIRIVSIIEKWVEQANKETEEQTK